MEDCFTFSSAFSDAPSRLHKGNSGSCGTGRGDLWNTIVSSVCPGRRATCASTWVHIQLCFHLFYYFLPFADNQPWRALFLDYSNLQLLFFCLTAFPEKNTSLKTTTRRNYKKRDKNHQNQKTAHQKFPDRFPYHPALKQHLSRRLNGYPKASPICFTNYSLQDTSGETPHSRDHTVPEASWTWVSKTVISISKTICSLRKNR